MIDEVELKSIVPDFADARRRVEAAGGRLVFEGRLEDRRYDDSARTLALQDHVLRVRTYRDASGSRASVDWKGPTRVEGGYKVREELSTSATDGDVVASILERLGYEVIREIDRDIAQFELAGAVVRFERYPRLDVLVEVEGPPDRIEAAIAVLGLPREGFSTDRLLAFVQRFEARTGQRAAVNDLELAGDYHQRAMEEGW
jgi:predicted adenylyl cyclase CyaB